ncbi:VOC family protein [Sulfitobacter pontiacus]|uniref:VOC family protein n=1 Tax=Sulfitobacter pontiacus TaxID=60137 RepID=UPI000446B13C|nr:VOC family protein [Sulfitobacter pontiacus]KAJ31578.1 glyoxalase [Sulfitobacter pontiacus 3SOLIMAR09]
MTKMNAVGWFDIYVDDLDRAVGFYEAMLDTKLESMPDPSGEMQMMTFPTEMTAYGAGGALTKAPYAGPGGGGTIVYFMVEDCATQEERATSAGGSVAQPKTSIGEFGWILVCQDTEGNMVGFHSMQ